MGQRAIIIILFEENETKFIAVSIIIGIALNKRFKLMFLVLFFVLNGFFPRFTNRFVIGILLVSSLPLINGTIKVF